MAGLVIPGEKGCILKRLCEVGRFVELCCNFGFDELLDEPSHNLANNEASTVQAGGTQQGEPQCAGKFGQIAQAIEKGCHEIDEGQTIRKFDSQSKLPLRDDSVRTGQQSPTRTDIRFYPAFDRDRQRQPQN